MADVYDNSPNPRRLYRSSDDRVISGVCGGLAQNYGWDPTLLRVIALLLLFVAGPITFIVYVVLWAITPRRSGPLRRLAPEEDRFWRGVSTKPAVVFSNLKYKMRDLDQRLQALERAAVSEEAQLKRAFKDLERSAADTGPTP
jgi:phage shock protein C